MKNAAEKLHALGVEYCDAWTYAIESGDGDCVDVNETYLNDKFPSLVGELFPNLNESDVEDLSGYCFAATEGFDSPGMGFSVEDVVEVLDKFHRMIAMDGKCRKYPSM